MMLHIVGTSLGAGMTRAVFIKTAKANGVFGGLDEEDDISVDPSKIEDSKKDDKKTGKKEKKETKKT